MKGASMVVRFIPIPQPTLLVGPGSSGRLGQAVAGFGHKKILIVTDAIIAKLGLLKDLTDALTAGPPMGIKTHRTIAREAVGVVGAITPWNFPHQINLAKIGPALAAGNTVVLKPAPDTPWCAAAIGQLIAEHTDIPPGVINIVTSSDHGVGALLSKDPRVDMVSFTGSTATGRAVMSDGAAILKKVFLELGGKSAFLVLDDADLAGACSMSAFTASMHAGQGCAITTRLVVPRARYDEAVEAAAATMGSLKPGDPTDAGYRSAGRSFRRGSGTGVQGYLDRPSTRAATAPAAVDVPRTETPAFSSSRP